MEAVIKDLEFLQENLKKQKNKSKELKESETEEINLATSMIKMKYAKQKKTINEGILETINDIESYCNKIQLYSTFNTNIMVILENLITIFEGEEYCYQEADYHTTRTEHCVFDRVEIDVDEKIRIIINGNYQDPDCIYDYRFNNITKLVENKKAILFEKTDYKLDPNIKFYRVNGTKNGIESNVLYGKFDYVKKFIDSVITYRIDNNINNNKNRHYLYELLSEFINDNINFIEANQQQRLQEKEEKLKQEVENNKNRYSNQLKKYLNRD